MLGNEMTVLAAHDPGGAQIKFGCTLCGRCCHDHNLPLTWEESIGWLEDGGKVGIFCEAGPWPNEGQEDLRAAHRRKRSFGVSCGASRARVTAILVAIISGACKNLGEDLKCGIYERRPLVCRIYPAEISPFIQLNTADKVCPPEAWTSGETLLWQGKIADANLQSLVDKSRQTDRDDVPRKIALCRDLRMRVAAVGGEGYVTYQPEGKTLLDALRRTRAADVNAPQAKQDWRLYSPSLTTTESLRAKGFEMVTAPRPGDIYSFLHSAGRPTGELPVSWEQ